MTVFSCSNCGFRFEGAGAKSCPRCASAEVSEFRQSRHERGGVTVVREERPVIEGGPANPHHKLVHYREGKEGWRDFHNQQATACPNCGGTEFDRDAKRKEKVCRKCGEVMSLPRRFA